MFTTAKIRASFLEYFNQHQHSIVSSSSLIPHNDDTLLFTNAGMVQFKDVFLGADKRPYTRATTSQKCLRAGGKHNDLENVGYTARHHTFFEMLGNFSFGDYFKREAIQFAWNYLTEVLKLPKEKLWITVFEEDQEAEDIWVNEIGVAKDRVSKIGAKDNFWAMGDTGPCGPCSEIFYDHGPSVAGGPPGTPEEDGDRYIEIWNIVFMQYNRLADGTLENLPNPSVDTGMGLERIAAVLQGVHSNYEIDLFQAIIKHIANLLNVNDLTLPSLKVVADHIRACSFLIADGVVPSNEGRGYVLRRIIRRAIRHGYKLGANETFFYKVVSELVAQMGDAYPDLVTKKAHIEQVLMKEEQQFEKTLTHGMKVFEEAVAELKNNILDGEIVFKLYDTYGFPVDLTADIARERQLEVDHDGFEAHMQAQRNRAKAASKFSVDYNQMIKPTTETLFLGYSLLVSDAVVKEIFVDGQTTNDVLAGQEAMIVLDRTPFYAESGGQIGDQGVIETFAGVFEITDTQKMGTSIVHIGKIAKGKISVDDEVTASVTSELRRTTAAHHSATHLLHAALRNVLGEHVEQKGSLVEADKLRFDFSHDGGLTVQQKRQVENMVNAAIRTNYMAETVETTPEIAQSMGAMALFGEKYGDIVRVLQFGDYSIELCGGTHVTATGDIGLFKIISESGIASGVRRIEAVVGDYAEQYIDQRLALLDDLNQALKASDVTLLEKFEKIQQQLKDQEKQINKLKSDLISGKSTALEAKALKDALLVNAILPNADMKILRDKIDEFKSKHDNVIVVLATENEGKAQIAVGVSKAITDRVKAGELVNFIAQQVGGKGGGRPDMAQAGGTEPQNLNSAIDSVIKWVENKL